MMTTRLIGLGLGRCSSGSLLAGTPALSHDICADAETKTMERGTCDSDSCDADLCDSDSGSGSAFSGWKMCRPGFSVGNFVDRTANNDCTGRLAQSRAPVKKGNSVWIG